MRQLIIARKDLQMSPGKLAAQCCHASLAFLTDPIGMGQGVEPIEKDGEITGYRAEIMLEKATYEEWFDGSFTKTVCGAKNRNQLLKAKTIAEELGLVESKDNCRGIGTGGKQRLLPYPGCLPHRAGAGRI